MSDKAEDTLQDIGKVAKAGLGVLLRAAAIGIGVTVLGGVAAGVIVGTAGFGGWAIAGGVFAGLFGGGYAGKWFAGNYIEKNSGPAIVVAGNVLDKVSKEMSPDGKGLDLNGLAKKFEEIAEKSAAATPAPATPAPVVAEPKAPAQTM